MSEAPINIKSDSKQLMLEATGFTDNKGKIVSNLTLRGPNGIELSLPSKLFPFLEPGVSLIVLSVVQITVNMPTIEQPGLIIPGAN